MKILFLIWLIVNFFFVLWAIGKYRKSKKNQ